MNDFKYILFNKQEKPEFNYLVQIVSRPDEYWLYTNFDSAYFKMKSLAKESNCITHILEPKLYKNEYVMYRSFKYTDSVQHLNKPERLLHAKYYTDAGVWKNYIRSGIR